MAKCKLVATLLVTNKKGELKFKRIVIRGKFIYRLLDKFYCYFPELLSKYRVIAVSVNLKRKGCDCTHLL